jgi:ribosomal protein S18 acetylase RimI-like enzyme
MPAAAIKGLTDEPWLAGILDTPVYRVTDDWEPARGGLPKGPLFAYAKAATHDVGRCHALEDAGFRLVDTQVLIEKCPEVRAHVVPFVRRARAEDEDEVAAIAATSFRWTRFHQDPVISKSRADAVKEAWVRSYFRGTRGDTCLVAERDGAIAGFVIAFDGEAWATADLMAIGEAHRRMGIGRALMLGFEHAYPNAARYRLGTQLANTPSLHMYHTLGYRIIESTYVFHFHRTCV